MSLAAFSNLGQWTRQAPQPFQPSPSFIGSQNSKIVSSLPVISATAPSAAQSASQSSSASNGSASTGSVSTSGASGSGVPQSVLEALASCVTPTQEAWNTLAQSLRLGDVAAAQNALVDYTVDLAGPNNSSMLAATTPAATFLGYLTSVGDALASGNLDDARSAFANAVLWRPDTATEAVSSAQGAAEGDGWLALYRLENPGSGSISDLPLASDIASLDQALREEQADIGDELVALGYNQSDASKYSEAIAGIGNLSAAGNAQVDASRASQWIQGLIGAAQNAIAAHGPTDQVANDLSKTASTLLTGIEFANIDGWKQLQTLIDTTLGPASGPVFESASDGTGHASAYAASVSAVADARLTAVA